MNTLYSIDPITGQASRLLPTIMQRGIVTITTGHREVNYEVSPEDYAALRKEFEKQPATWKEYIDKKYDLRLRPSFENKPAEMAEMVQL